MPPFTRSMKAELPYDESVTVLRAPDLLEEGTQCPQCYVEILPHEIIFLHRGCANIICSSCFKSQMSNELDVDVERCPNCNGYLANPYGRDAIPNFRFTYTNIPLPSVPNHASNGHPGLPGPSLGCTAPSEDTVMSSPLYSPPHGFNFCGEGQPFASASPTYNAAPGLQSVYTELKKLRAELAERQTQRRDFRSHRALNPTKDTRCWQQSNTGPTGLQNSWNSQYRIYKSHEVQNDTNPNYDVSSTFRPRNKVNPQQEDNTNPRPRPHANAHNQHNIKPQHEYLTSLRNITTQPWNKTNLLSQCNAKPQQRGNPNPQGQKTTNHRYEKIPNPKQRDPSNQFNRQGLDPTLKYNYGSKSLPRQRQWQPSQKHAQDNGAQSQPAFREGVWKHPNWQKPRYRANYGAAWAKSQNNGPPGNLQKNLRRARSSPPFSS
jgi:hypothetical protein